MRLAWLPLILAASLPLVACRSSQQPAAPETSAARPAPSDPTPSAPPVASAPTASAAPDLASDPRPRIVCFGDSLTAGFGTEPGESYPDDLQRLLDSNGYHFRVVNEGISGNTTKDGLERVDRVLALHPAIVVVEFGGNDGLRGLRIEDTQSNLDAILSRLKASGANIALAGITLPPDYGPDYIHRFESTYTALAAKYRLPFLPFLLKGVFGTDGMMQRDRTHATARGNVVVARNVFTLVKPLLKKSSAPTTRGE